MGRTMKGWWESMPRGGGDGWSGKRWRNCPTWLWLCPPLLQFYQLFFQDEDSDGSHNLHIWLVSLPHPYPPSISIAHSPYPFNVEEPSAIPIPSRPHHNPAPHLPHPQAPAPPRPTPHTHTYSIHIISHISCLVSLSVMTSFSICLLLTSIRWQLHNRETVGQDITMVWLFSAFDSTNFSRRPKFLNLLFWVGAITHNEFWVGGYGLVGLDPSWSWSLQVWRPGRINESVELMRSLRINGSWVLRKVLIIG